MTAGPESPPIESHFAVLSVIAASLLAAFPVCWLLSLEDMAIHGYSPLFWTSLLMYVFSLIASALVVGASSALRRKVRFSATWWFRLSAVVLGICALILLVAIVSEL